MSSATYGPKERSRLGRVLVALATEMPQLFLEEIASPALTWQGLAAAGLSMTEPEWKDL